MPVRQDYLLRMIEQAFEVLRRILKRRQDGDLVQAVREADGAVDEILGPAAAIALRLDSFTAAQLIREPERVALWARVTAEKAEALRELGDEPGARAAGRRALELSLEAWLLEDEQRRLTPALREVLAEALEMARAWAAPDPLSDRHRAALEGALRGLARR
jgi:predicted NACHT family NTPase